jgi:hypothetical protein
MLAWHHYGHHIVFSEQVNDPLLDEITWPSFVEQVTGDEQRRAFLGQVQNEPDFLFLCLKKIIFPCTRWGTP